MALFNRKKKPTTDINEYYASERRRRVGMAWLLGAVTLIVTLIIAVAIFYGGRWLYRAVFDSNKDNGTTSQQDQTGTTSDSDEASDTDGLLDNITIGEGEDNTDDENSSTTDDEQSDADRERITGSQTDENSDNNNESSDDSSGDIPNVGPSGPESLR